MHLIQSLASGIVGGANGSVTLVRRGTSTPVQYFTDFEATQAIQSTLDGIPLDANGGLVAYVNELVDVTVLDVNGVQLREFVAGDNANAVEVISPSFTGTDYVTGVTGTDKPTTLQAILDLWLTSAGEPDFNVAVSGVSTSLKLAVAGLSGLFFNVKSYGAIGDGVADDGAAIQAACNAAAATDNVGGIVFFPPGTYRGTTTVQVAPGVSLMGCGGTSTKVRVDNPALGSLFLFNGADSGSRSVQGLWFGALSNFTPPLVIVSSAGPCVDFVGCVFGGDPFTNGQLLSVSATGQGSRTTVTRCTFYQGANASCIVQTNSGRIAVRDSDLVITFAGSYSNQVIGGTDGVAVHDCRFNCDAVTAGTPVYIGFAPNTWQGCVFTGNYFKGSAAVTPIALFNGLASPKFDCYEAGNVFGDSSASAITPYAYTTDGFETLGLWNGSANHNSRYGRTQQVSGTNGSALVFDPKSYGMGVIKVTAGPGSLTFAGNKGQLGDRYVLVVVNSSGGNIICAPDVNFVLDATLGPSFTVATGTRQVYEFVCVPNNTTSTTVFAQISKPAQT